MSGYDRQKAYLILVSLPSLVSFLRFHKRGSTVNKQKLLSTVNIITINKHRFI